MVVRMTKDQDLKIYMISFWVAKEVGCEIGTKISNFDKVLQKMHFFKFEVGYSLVSDPVKMLKKCSVHMEA